MAVEFNNPVKDPGYYLREPSSIERRFEGKAAAILGMEWSEQAYLNLYAGYTTDAEGHRETRLPDYIRHDRKGAVGITFNLPKSGSIVKELAGDARVDDVMTVARREAMREVERQFYVRSPFERTGNLIWTTFRHSSSREGDPHSHDHVIIANLSLSKAKGRNQWKAIEMRYLDYGGIAGVYNDSLQKGFNQLGYKTRAVGNEFEIVGCPAEVKAEFSRRNAAIRGMREDYESRTGKPMSSKAKSKLSIYNRPEKPDNMPPEERRKGWLARLSGSQRKAVAGMVGKSRMAIRRGRWRAGLRKHLGMFRPSAIVKDTPTHDREPSRGR